MSRRKKNLRAFLHQNPDATIEEAWNAAWEGAQKRYHAKSMNELQAKIDRLTSRGIEQLRFDNAELEAELEKAALRESNAVAFEIRTQSELQSAHQERDRLREALVDAIDGYQECAPYKGDYLYKKHGDDKEIARLKALLEGE